MVGVVNAMNSENLQTLEPPPGIICPCCRGCETRLAGDHGRAELHRAGCGTFWRLLQRRGDPAPALDFADEQADVPPAGSW
jgi:hypothetical protein